MMYDLGKKDLKILKYVRKKQPTREGIRQKFLFDADPRIIKLIDYGYIYFNDDKDTWGTILNEGPAELTNSGLMALENITDDKRSNQISFVIRNIIVPVGISIVTSILTTIITLQVSKLL